MATATVLTWIGILLCVLNSGSFSGLNLSLFGISMRNLESLAATGSRDAVRLLELRRDPNFLLATVLWGNVGTNVLLTLLTDSVLAGATGFVFSTFVITFGGEIVPQAYFSRNAMRMATLMRPFLRFWQLALFPLAKPTAMMLDAWLGPESIDYLREHELREEIKSYITSPVSEIGRVEGIGALNFLAIDDIPVLEEGQDLDPDSILELPVENGVPVFPAFEPSRSDPFLRRIDASGRKWLTLVSREGEPVRVLDADAFLRAVLMNGAAVQIEQFCHRPVVVHESSAMVADVLPRLRLERSTAGDQVMGNDLILVWGSRRRIITGADILGRLLRGIAAPMS